MAPNTEWMSMMKEEIKKSPLASRFCFGLVLFALEKIVEIDFACPCNPTWNPWFVSSFFVFPAVIVFMLMCNIQGCKCSKALMHSAFPALLWVIILFIDGRYYACAKTSWTGKYEVLEKASFQRWCNPSNSSLNYVTDAQEWYSESQFMGISMAFGMALLYQTDLCSRRCCCNEV